MAVLWCCLAIVAGVFAVMIHSIATFRQRDAAGRVPLRHNALVEVLWAIVPIAIMIGMALPSIREILTIEDGPRAVEPQRQQHEYFS